MKTVFNTDDVLSYFVDESNNIYQMIGYCPFPTAIIEDVRTGKVQHIVIDCLNAQSYTKLIKECE